MRILGIDPGTSLLGYGIIDASKTSSTVVSFGSFRTASKLENRERVLDVYNFFSKLIIKYSPDVLAIEKLFFFKNAKTVMQVSEMRGVLLLLAVQSNLKIREFTPLEVKQAISGYGRAGKDQIGAMVKVILNLNEVPKPDDVSDALAIAICAANTVQY